MNAEMQQRKQRRLEKIFRLQTEFLETALADTREILALIDVPGSAMATKDGERLCKLAHDLRGTGAAFGFSSLSDTAAHLEQAVASTDPALEVRRCVDDLISAVAEARTSRKVVPSV
jgi:HPt (histidine-containing phosphotransfer) domain-containing protein